MSHTNSTANYNLPQFVATDKPAWLVDVNGAYRDIDLAIKNAADSASGAAGDASTALTTATAASTAASNASAKATGAIDSLADTFSTSSTYEVDDVVIYNNLMYTCIADVSTPGAWTGSTNWNRITAEDLVDRLTTKIYLELAYKSPKSQEFTFTADNAVMASGVQALKTDRQCMIAAEVRFTAPASTWVTLGTMSVGPDVASHVVGAGINTSNGDYMGLISIEHDGRVRIYCPTAVNNGFVGFSIPFRAAN